MIPDRVVEVIHGPAWMYVATRDETLRPAHAWVVGAVVHQDREAVTVFVPERRSEKILANLKNNGRIALAAALASHEAYQLKGTYLSSRPTDEKDRAIQEIYQPKLYADGLRTGYPEPIIRPLALGFAYQPGVAITFRVEEVFLQTPGPEAGKKLV
jgi:hypothetical protein